MDNLKKVCISKDYFEKLKSKKIGEGRDSIVYNAGKGYLFKVYKDEAGLKNQYDDTLKTKIYTKGQIINNFGNKNSYANYIDSDNVKIYYKEAIKKIVERQKEIKHSYLPQASLYIDRKFSGCVLKRVRGVQIHYIWPFLSKRNKIKILKEILEKVKELSDHYIYPMDTANSPIAGKHSNILIDRKLKPQLIDLDGNSTVYRESFDKQVYDEMFFSLNMLFLELLYGFELNDSLEEEDLFKIKSILEESNLRKELIDKLVEFKANFNELNELTDHFSRK